MASNPTVPEYSQVSLKSLKLRAGMFLQAQRVEKISSDYERRESPNYEAQFLGVIDGKCLMVVPVGTFSIKTGMKAGETFTVRGFTGQYDFRFTSNVIQAFDFTFREPAYAYAVLSFPEVVESRKVRNSMRIKTSLPASATPQGSQTSIAVTLLDLSVDGSLVRSPTPLGAVGDLVSLEFSMAAEGSESELAFLVALARICHSNKANNEEGYLSGLLFENITAKDKLTLKEFVLSNLE
jgi:c-di-GMP-binding flagellar brake protein YcgR